jgi:hypothetical protein
MNSIYHILDKVPAIYPEDMQIEYEQLAQKLVKSGKLRIDTDYYCNFVKFSDPNSDISIFFSYDELTNPELLQESKETVCRIYRERKKMISDKKLSTIMIDLNRKIGKLLLVSDELKMQLARIFVQSAHPIAIRWLLIDKVEIFITYSNTIGDMMDISTWKRAGDNSGMQSTDGKNVCIYVSCGGDPFAENNKANPTYGNGWAALARLQIIAGQEIGHFADIKRDRNGKQISRHSANFACTKATSHVKIARKNDIERCKQLLYTLKKCGLNKIVPIENKLKFYDKQKISGIRILWLKLYGKYYRGRILFATQRKKLFFVKRFDREKYIGLSLIAMIEDMHSHLAPIADVYKRDDPEAEEAINCVEALARVPQQVNKWGYLTTRATMHDLYKIYYNEVIPSLIENYQNFTKTRYRRNFNLPKVNLMKRLLNKLRVTKRKSKFQFTEVRDL